MFNLNDFDLGKLVPPNLKSDPTISAAIASINGELQQVSALCELPFIYSRIDSMTEDELDHLAWEWFFVSFEWGLANTVEKKRELIKNAYLLNRKRGTRWAVERVLSLLDYEVTLQSWWEFGGEPNTFRIITDAVADVGLQIAQIETLVKLIEEYKRHSQHLADFAVEINVVEATSSYAGAVATSIATIDLYPAIETPEILEANIQQPTAVGVMMSMRVIVPSEIYEPPPPPAPPGLVWFGREEAASNEWESITETTQGAWAGRLVAVSRTGTGNRVMTSDDGGDTWVTRSSPIDNQWTSVVETKLGAWAGRLVAVARSGSGNRVMTSEDGGVTWTLRTGISDRFWGCVIETTQGAWAGRLVATDLGDSSNRVMISDDGGVTWTSYLTSISRGFVEFCETTQGAWAGRLVAVSAFGSTSRVMVSDNGGVTWSLIASSPLNAWTGICETTQGAWAGRLVAVSESGVGNRVMTSDDGGDTWTLRSSASDADWQAIIELSQGRLVAVADNNGDERVMYSDDGGITWLPVTLGDFGNSSGWFSLVETTQGEWAGRIVAVARTGTALTNSQMVMISDPG